MKAAVYYRPAAVHAYIESRQAIGRVLLTL